MNILEQIIAAKQKEIAERKALYPTSLLERSKYFGTKPVSMKYYLEQKNPTGIIAEFKRKSPSKSWINKYAQADEVSLSYMQAGAAALSVLTDEPFFGAKSKDFEQARELNYCPILRKDFIINEYQIIETKSMGADVLLLIAKILSEKQIINYTKLAHILGLEVFLELQDEAEVLAHSDSEADIIGINNRNLKDFSVDFENSAKLASLLPSNKTLVAESGIQSAKDIHYLRQVGFKGFLMGTQFMKSSNPGLACKNLINELRNED